MICKLSYVDPLKPGVRDFCICARRFFFFLFFCICARSEMSFEIFGFLREDFFKFHGPPKRLRIIISYFYFLRFSDF